MKVYIITLMLLIPSFSYGALENLDEVISRKSRLASATWNNTLLEDPTTLVWQPETLIYTDVTTGHEVTRISSTKQLRNSLPDISWAHWSADGKRFSYGSHRATGANASSYATDSNYSYQGSVMMMRADGSYLRPADGAPFEVFVHERFLHWSPTEPDVYYGFGNNYAGEGAYPDHLYRVVVGDTSISKTDILDMNQGGSEVYLWKDFSSDGMKLIPSVNNKMWSISLSGGAATLDDADGWAIYRPLDNYWGNTPGTTYHYHDEFLRGYAGNYWLYFMPQIDAEASWWRMRLSGSGADGGPSHTGDDSAPYNWGGELEPVFTGSGSGGSGCLAGSRSPWNCDADGATGPESYLGHPGFDRWGRYVAGVNSQLYRGWGVWDLTNHSWSAANISAPHYNWHGDWSAWSDHFAQGASGSYATNDHVFSPKYDGSITIDVASTHAGVNSSIEYNAAPRVTQSPDGTKLTYHSEFLYSQAEAWDLFYAVAYYPHPPEITSVTGSGTYTIRFDWRTDQTTSRGYTQRGWPDEATNDPPPPRETKLFRLWRSTTGTSGWTPVATVDADIFSRYNFSTGTWSGNNYWTFTDTPGAGTFYYAVTAQEHSGLESRTLSNVFSTASTQMTAYPVDPKGGIGVTSTHQTGLIRHYNIYAKDGSTPAISQTTRIASIPVASNKSYVDWLGDTGGTTQYVVTAVDSQGNEGGALSATRTVLGTPGQYSLSWTDTPGSSGTAKVSTGNGKFKSGSGKFVQ